MPHPTQEAPQPNLASAFVRYQHSTAGMLRYDLAERNIEKLHPRHGRLRVLDAGGGNGINTTAFLKRGHDVTLYDSNAELIEQVRVRLACSDDGDRCRLVEGHLADIAARLVGEQFNLIVCHHVVEYLDDVPRLLQDLRGLGAPGVELSLVTLNPVSEVLRAVMFQQNAALAATRLENLDYDARWFGQARLYHWEQMVAWAEAAGWRLRDYMGIRVFADYMLKAEAAGPVPADLIALEEAVSDRDPYRRMARYFQFCFE